MITEKKKRSDHLMSINLAEYEVQAKTTGAENWLIEQRTSVFIKHMAEKHEQGTVGKEWLCWISFSISIEKKATEGMTTFKMITGATFFFIGGGV